MWVSSGPEHCESFAGAWHIAGSAQGLAMIEYIGGWYMSSAKLAQKLIHALRIIYFGVSILFSFCLRHKGGDGFFIAKYGRVPDGI